MGDLLSTEPGVLVGLFLAATVVLWIVQWLRIVRLVLSLVAGTSTVTAVLLIVHWVTVADQIESAIHQIYHVGVLIAAILCVGLSMACLGWFSSSTETKDEDDESEATTTPTRHDLPQASPDAERQRMAEHEREKNFDEQRQQVRDLVARERAARQDEA